MKYSYIIIDGTNLFWRCFSISLKQYIVDEKYDIFPQAIQYSLHNIESLHKKYGYKNSEVFILFDNPESILNIRKIICDDYKSIRMKKQAPKGFYNSFKVFSHLLRYYNDCYKIVQINSLEADDLTYPIIEKLKLSTLKKCLCISNDLDWARNLSNFVDYWNYKKLYTIAGFKKEFNFSPEGKAVQIYKAIHGDASDSIVNAVPYLPKEILLDIVTKFDNIYVLFKNLYKQDYPDKWKNKIKEAEKQIKINYQLTDFILIDKDITNFIYQCKRNIKMLVVLYKSLDIHYETWMLKVAEEVDKGNTKKEKNILF